MEDLLDNIIKDFHPERFIHFFRQKNSRFKPFREEHSYLDDENFFNSLKLGEIPFNEVEKLVVYAFQVKNPLSERSGKKAQYEKGKKILKQESADAGIFIFYDERGSFRFSLIYTEYFGSKREWTHFKRFTYFVSKDQTNKTFKKQIGEGNFESLDSIKSAFSVEKVTKEFYQEIANWYFWAFDKITLPEDYKYSDDDAKDDEIRRATSLIRLITRVIFIWFIKQKGLVPDNLFNKEALKGIVKDFGSSDNYYNAILQNLFFATLNQRVEEREFAKEGNFLENRTEFGIKTLYRYSDKFLISKEEVIKLFSKIPFLNGGLFDCLDKDGLYIDGFSRNPKKRAIIPDYIFYQEDTENVDLSKYGLGRNKPVRGLIEILKTYNFTIDESTPVDQEIALDPELLGKIFENLLASYNPETSQTARKATGSYYTPREIVDYMVDASLKAYLKVTEASRFAKVAKASPLCNEVTESSCFAYPFFNPNQDLKVHYGKKGTLPHWQQGDVWYFVTFRLADSLPAEKVEELKAKREAWLKQHGGSLDNLNEQEREEYYKLFSDKVEEWLNAGYGSCILKDYEIAKIVKDTLCYFDGKRYILDEWVIMPNHVHVLVKPIDNNSISDILHSWKSYSAKQILKVIEASCFADKVNEASRFAKVTKASSLCPSSHQVWLHESYDHIVRNENAFNAIRKYIRENPEKANITILDICCSWKLNNEFTNQDGSDTLRSEGASITQLLSYSDDVPPLTEEEKIAIVKAISEIKILDPACGSGAFPMGILHKLILILQKVDPENTLWYKLQREKVLKELEEVLNHEDKKEREELLDEINSAFDTKINYPDYARKLFLIENCIYGVDIQPIAIQIAKLRFFISLIIDQNVDMTKENFGIRPLPNLETKFVCANTLIGLDKPNGALISQQVTRLEEAIKSLRHRYFQAKTRSQKLNLQKKDRELREKLAKELEKGGFSTEASNKIANFDLYDQNASAEWFDPEWMFGVTDGFDIVIGNPPHGADISNYLEKITPYHNIYDSRKNSASFFISLANRLIKQNGVTAYIIPKSLTYVEGWKPTREFILSKNQLLVVLDISKSFENVLLEQVVVIFKNSGTKSDYEIKMGSSWDKHIYLFGKIRKDRTQQLGIMPCYIDNDKLNILEKLLDRSIPLANITTTFRGLPWQKKISKYGEPILRGKNVGRYSIKGKLDNVSISYIEKNIKKVLLLRQKKIISQNIVAHVMNPYDHIVIMATLDNIGLLTLDTCMNTFLKDLNYSYEYILAILNSKLASWFYYWFVYNRAVRTMHFDEYYIGKLPIKVIQLKEQKPFIELINKRLSLSLTNYENDMRHLEKEIDRLVFEIYGLNEKDIKLIENKL